VNVDFLHFIWQHFEQFGFRKHVIAIIPHTLTAHHESHRIRLLCI
jgi:hypothetical protein